MCEQKRHRYVRIIEIFYFLQTLNELCHNVKQGKWFWILGGLIESGIWEGSEDFKIWWNLESFVEFKDFDEDI